MLEVLADRPLVVLTGAGCSTDSGIPDYRGPGTPVRTPMTYQEFVSGPEAQQRYWARSHLGWGRMKGAEPNAGHRALARIDPELLITQNVDGLHERAGSRRLVALHGRIADVVCLSLPRHLLTRRAAPAADRAQPRLRRPTSRNDGPARRRRRARRHPRLRAGRLSRCGGVLKPHVVFFGENVPVDRVERCYAAVDALVEADGALVVAGSSLTVMSGLRFVRRAAKAGTPVVIANRGDTRGDDLATYRLHAGTSEFLTALARDGAAEQRRSADRRRSGRRPGAAAW